MLDLYEKLTDLDNKRITNYIESWGVEYGYIGNKTYLQEWAKNKKKLYKLLGSNLILKKHFEYNKPYYMIEKEINKLISYKGDFYDFYNSCKKFIIDVCEREHIEDKYDLLDAFSLTSFARDEIQCFSPIKIKIADKKGSLRIQKGMKPIRALQKTLQFFDCQDKYMLKSLENFRIALSMVFNEKTIEGDLCISIHPLDFMTMSDNESDWSSCMSWIHQGCYHVGTVEMMNSNNVVCAYVESKTPFHFARRDCKEKNTGEEWYWNNKKWRQLFYITKDIVVGGKSYPYANEEISKEVLKILRELSENNLKVTYTFGPELYRDMKHITTSRHMDMNRMWIASGNTTKHNIIFDTKGMYNDMLNDTSRHYWCIRNKPKRNKMISISGKAPCLCCMAPVIYENDDCDYDDEYYDNYNSRYRNTGNVICDRCSDSRICDFCDNENHYYSTYNLENCSYCRECWDAFVKTCPCCGKPFHCKREGGNTIYIKLKDNPFYIQDISAHSITGGACSNCIDEMIEKGILKRTNIYADESRQYYYWDRHRRILLTTQKHTLDDEFVKKFSTGHLVTYPKEDYLV